MVHPSSRKRKPKMPLLLRIMEQTEPPSPATEHSPLITTTDSQQILQPPLMIPDSPSSHSQTEPLIRHMSLSQRVLNMLCIPNRRRSSSSRPTSQLTPCPSRFCRRRRTSFDNRYHSFPPPEFTGQGQPRALDSRLYPELLADEEDSHEDDSAEDHRYWSHRRHLLAEIVADQRRAAGNSTVKQERRSLHHSGPDDTAEAESPANDVESALQPAESPPRLSLRGGRLPDAQRLPSLPWRLAGGAGPPPTAGEYRAWRKSEMERIAEANRRNGRGDKEGRGFWREVWWVLGGARMENRRRQNRREDGGRD